MLLSYILLQITIAVAAFSPKIQCRALLYFMAVVLLRQSQYVVVASCFRKLKSTSLNSLQVSDSIKFHENLSVDAEAER